MIQWHRRAGHLCPGIACRVKYAHRMSASAPDYVQLAVKLDSACFMTFFNLTTISCLVVG